MVTEIEHPLAGMIQMLGLPIVMDGTPTSIRRPPPTLGEHTDEILVDFLGMEPDTIESLRAEGVV